MTIAVALQVHDGVVLASDSAITLTNPGKSPPDNIWNVYGHGNKIFNLVKGLPIGAAFYGAANFGTSSVPTLVKDLRRRLSGEDKKFRSWKLASDSFTIKEVSEKSRQFLFEEIFSKLNPLPQDAQFGFIVAGYSAGAQLSETWSFTIDKGTCNPPNEVMAQGVSNVMGGGDPDAMLRLVNGYSPALSEVLSKAGVDALTVGKVMGAAAGGLGLALVEAPMPIQDAIGLAEFFVETTSRLAHYKRGFSTVGGPTESAAITKHEGFRWVKRKHYFDKSLNPGD